MIQAIITILVISLIGAIPLLTAFGFSEIVRRW